MILLVAPALALAQQPGTVHWQRTSGPVGGRISDIAHDNDTLYAAEGNFGPGDLFRSTDRGDTWSSIASGLGAGSQGTIEHVAVTRTHIFCSTHAGFFALPKSSLSSGASSYVWDSILPYAQAYHIDAFVAKDTEMLAASQSKGVFRSTDNGVTWTRFDAANPSVKINAILHLAPVILMATQGGGIYRSTDNGASWAFSNALANNAGSIGGDDLYASMLFEHDGVIFVGTLRGLYRSTDLGSTWESDRTGFPIDWGPSAMAASGGLLYAALGSDGLYASSDKGDHWEKFNLVMQGETLDITAFCVLPSNSGTPADQIFLGSGSDAIFRTEPGKAELAAAGNGINSTSVLCIRPLVLQNGSVALLAGTLDADFGHGWISQTVGNHDRIWTPIPSLTDRGVHDFSQRDGVFFCAVEGEGVFRSTDFGNGWQVADGPVGGGNYPVSIVQTPSATLVAMTTTVGIARSSDLGLTWTTPTQSTIGSVFQHLYYDTVTSISYASASIGYYTSKNDGLHWDAPDATRPGGPAAIDSVQIFDMLRAATIDHAADNLVAATWNGIEFSSDNGSSWTLVTKASDGITPLGKIVTLANASLYTSAASGTVFAGGTRGIWISKDKGRSWSQYGDLPRGVEVLSICANNDELLIGTSGLGIWRAGSSSPAAVSNNAPIEGPRRLPIYSSAGLELRFSLAEASVVTYSVTDVTGRNVLTGITPQLSSGEQSITLDGHALSVLPHGVYFVEIRGGSSRFLMKFAN